MRLYRIISPLENKWAGSEAEARKVRLEAMQTQNVKRADTDVEQIEVPTTKQELIKFLNEREQGK
jgi:hypothetical protein